ncbi:MAG TPA: PIG-L family deacetylase [Elusimicrobiota bacterium]|nr:PIG-L family deacetylase [Elusimicrobiota bacterium]
MRHPYAGFVSEFESILERAARLPRGGLPPAPKAAPKPGAPRVLVLAPHPDDECIVGALPLRLQRESGWSVAVAPVTLGSRVERRAGRLEELRGACAFLGWDVLDAPDGALAELLLRERPRLLLFPHDGDANSTHRRVHALAVEALRAAGPSLRCAAAETEFWSTIPDPNLMVEAPAAVAADLVAGLSFHRGEIERNPYHVLLPCWLADGARRGAELVGGQGAKAPAFRFAALYRLSSWNGRGLERAAGPGRTAAAGDDLAALIA